MFEAWLRKATVVLWLLFLPVRCNLVRVLATVVCVCVCVCVCLSNARIVSNRLNVRSRKQCHMIAQGLVF